MQCLFPGLCRELSGDLLLGLIEGFDLGLLIAQPFLFHYGNLLQHVLVVMRYDLLELRKNLFEVLKNFFTLFSPLHAP